MYFEYFKQKGLLINASTILLYMLDDNFLKFG